MSPDAVDHPFRLTYGADTPLVPEIVSSGSLIFPLDDDRAGSDRLESIPFPSLKVAPGTQTPGTTTTALTIDHIVLTCVQPNQTY